MSYARLRELHTSVLAPRLSEVSEIEAHVIERCLEKDPADRYQSISELLEDLDGRGNKVTYDLTSENSNSDQISDDIADLWKRAYSCMSEGNLGEATRLCHVVLEDCPDHPEAKEMLDELNIRYAQAEQFYRAIEDSIDTQGLDELIELLEEAVRIYPDHPSSRLVQARLAAKTRRYREAMEQGLEAWNKECPEAVISYFRHVQELDPGNSDVVLSIEVVSRIHMHIKDMRQQIDEALAEKNFSRALKLASSLDRYTEQTFRRIDKEMARNRA